MALAPKIFASLADSTRLRILMLLRAMELSVGEIAQVLGQSQPRVSRHVKILIDAGLAERRKEGSWVFVSLGERSRLEPLFQLLERWSELDGDTPTTAAHAARPAAVRGARAPPAAPPPRRGAPGGRAPPPRRRGRALFRQPRRRLGRAALAPRRRDRG